MLRRFLLLAMTTGLVTGCADDDLPKVYILDRLRVLALIADKPEIGVAETVTITPYISDVGAEGRALTYSVTTCLDPGVGLGVTPDCDDLDDTQKVEVIQDQAITSLSGPNYTGPLTETFTVTPGVTAPSAALLFAGQSSEDQFNGVSLIIGFKIKAEDGLEVESFRRILVSTRTSTHSNPAFNAVPILSGEDALTEYPSVATTLTAQLDSGAESFVSQNDDGNETTEEEEIFVSWFVTAGEISITKTDDEEATGFTPPASTPADGRFVLVSVARDGRGGVAVAQQEF